MNANQVRFEDKVGNILEEIFDMLVSKNKAYGNAALDPMRIFSKLPANEGILIRIDDKLNRIKNKGLNGDTEDSLNDLIGYLVLLKISIEDARRTNSPAAQEKDNSVPYSNAKKRAALPNTRSGNQTITEPPTPFSEANTTSTLGARKPFEKGT